MYKLIKLNLPDTRQSFGGPHQLYLLTNEISNLIVDDYGEQ